MTDSLNNGILSGYRSLGLGAGQSPIPVPPFLPSSVPARINRTVKRSLESLQELLQIRKRLKIHDNPVSHPVAALLVVTPVIPATALVSITLQISHPVAALLVATPVIPATALVSITLQMLYDMVVIGKERWEELFPGDIFEFGDDQVACGAASMPDDLIQRLMQPCDLFPGNRVMDTRIVLRIPKTVNGQPFVLKRFEELLKRKLTGFRGVCSKIIEKYGDEPIEDSYWVMITKQLLNDSIGIGKKAAVAQLRALSVRSEVQYGFPKALEAASVFFFLFIKKPVQNLKFYCLETVRSGAATRTSSIYANVNEKGLWLSVGASSKIIPKIGTVAVARFGTRTPNLGIANTERLSPGLFLSAFKRSAPPLLLSHPSFEDEDFDLENFPPPPPTPPPPPSYPPPRPE